MDGSLGDNLVAEEKRLLDDNKRNSNWKRWGPYLSERQWATVREVRTKPRLQIYTKS